MSRPDNHDPCDPMLPEDPDEDRDMTDTEKMPTVTNAITPMQMLQIAVEQNADLDKLQKLMDLQERWEKNEARKAYVLAMNAFKKNPPDVYKTKDVSFGTTQYKHALLEKAVEIIGAELSKQGLSFRWDCEQLEGGLIRVSCVMTHTQGHSERVTLQAGADTSGSKNSIQAIASTVTYLERYTLFAITGLAAKGMDDDGNGPIEYISESQAADLNALLDEVKANKTAFCKYFKIKSVEELSVKALPDAIAMAEAKRKK